MEEKSPKPPPLTVVGKRPKNVPHPPRKLGSAGEVLWNRIQADYQIEDVGGVELLMQACEAADRTQTLAAIIDADGARIITKAGPNDHPCLKHELAARAFLVRTLTRLGVTEEPLKTIGRPTRPLGWTPDDY